METHSLKQTYYEDEHLLVEIEILENCIYLHCQVFKWTSSVLRKSYLIFTKLQQEAKEAGYLKLQTITPNPKFAQIFNGTTVGIVNYENKEYEVVEWVLK